MRGLLASPLIDPGHPRRRVASALHHRRNMDIAVPCLGPLDDQPGLRYAHSRRRGRVRHSSARHGTIEDTPAAAPAWPAARSAQGRIVRTPSISTTRSRKGCRRWRLASEEPALAMIAASSSPMRRMYAAAHDGPASPRASTNGSPQPVTAEPIAQSSWRLVEFMSTRAQTTIEC